MPYIIISQPKEGKTKEELLSEREACTEMLTMYGYEVVDDENTEESLIPDTVQNVELWNIGKLIKNMSRATVVYFVDGWSKSRECVIQHLVAEKLGMEITGSMK